MPRKRSGGSGSTKAPTGQAARYKGQKATQAKKTGTVLAGKGYGINTAPRSEVARTFGPSSAGSHPSPRYGYASRKARGADTSGLSSSSSSSSSSSASKSTKANSGGNKPSPPKITKKSKAIGKKYAANLVVAKSTVHGKSKAEREKILAAREKVRKMRERLTDNKGVKYGSSFKTKNGKLGGRGIYKALTGKSATTIKGLKKSKKGNQAVRGKK